MDIYFQQSAQPMVIYFTGGFNFNSYVVGGGGTVADGNYGDITVNGAGSNWFINTGVVSTSILGGDITPAGKALLDDVDTTAQLNTLGLSNVDNTADLNKPVSTAQAAADAAVATAAAAALTAHETATNPHPGYVPKQRYRSFWVGAGAMTPATTLGAAPATIETATNDVAYDVYKFDGATAESVWFVLRMPDEWDLGTVKVVIFWEPDTGGSGAVTWGVSGLSDSNDDALDSAVGTEVLVSDSVIAVGDLHVTSFSVPITIADTPALGDLIAFHVRRVPSDAGDTMTQDACLIGMSIQWRESSTEPAAW
jgi:hypothetical protein